ncbi:MAG: transglutaminase domain-containing protein [Methanoregula sp.]|uniref:transglutaminase domain-containing protein n=1 Tax=Methanoregula sp. TaxID=2052170 RepID=UPI003C4FDA19
MRHSWDYKANPVTLSASAVLERKTGYCFAKSHLLAALLRANAIPAGLCYQRLKNHADVGPAFYLHGLNAVWLEEYGWYRADARGGPMCMRSLRPPMSTSPLSPKSRARRT